MLLRRLRFAVGLALSFLLGALFVETLASQQPNGPNNAALLLLHRVQENHHGFDSLTCNEGTMNEEDEYLKEHAKNRPKVETAYDQKKVDEMKKALGDFWKEKGIAVEVRTTLTQLPKRPRYGILEFDVSKQ